MSTTERRSIADFLRVERVGGVLVIAAAAVALAVANSPLADEYADVLHSRVGPDVLDLRMTVSHWTADGLLALFFFVVGLEVKRELVVGELAGVRRAALPLLCAVAGMALPAALYMAVAWGEPGAGRGWAVPTATDIAFALAVLSLAGARAPAGLRVLLLSLAVVDDLIAIALIAVLYTGDLDPGPAALAGGCCAAYWLLQRARATPALVCVPLALVTWVAVHNSGVHATVAGVALGLLTRVRPDPGEARSPGQRLELLLQPLTAGVVVPLFALTAAGVPLDLTALGDAAADRAAAGVAVGLLAGKFAGVLGGGWLAVRLGAATLPPGVRWGDLAAVALLAGTGFTVSMLVTGLAFTDPARVERVTAAIVVTSTVASLAGALAVRRWSRGGEPTVAERPRDRLGRPLPPGSAGEPAVHADGLGPEESIALARRLLTEGRPFAAHEVLETRWKDRPRVERALWQGLAQLAVARTHAERGNDVGSQRLRERATTLLAGYDGPTYGLDLSAVVAEWTG